MDRVIGVRRPLQYRSHIIDPQCKTSWYGTPVPVFNMAGAHYADDQRLPRVAPNGCRGRLGRAIQVEEIVLRRKVPGRVRLTNNDRWFLVQIYRRFPTNA